MNVDDLRRAGDEFAREHDCSLMFGDDRAAMLRLHQKWGHPEFPGFRPDVNPEGQTIIVFQEDEPVMTYASVPYALDGDLCRHIERWGLFPSNRDQIRLGDGARDIAEHVTDLAIFNGGIVADPAYRKTAIVRALVTLLPVFGRYLGCERWGAEHTWFLVMEQIAKKMGSIGDRFGGEKLAGDVTWTRDGDLYRGNRYLGYTSRERAERQALEFISRPGG